MKLAFERGESFAQVTIKEVSEEANGVYLQTQGQTPSNDTDELGFKVGNTEVYNYGEDAKANLKLQINTHYKEATVSNWYAVVVDGCVFQKVVTD